MLRAITPVTDVSIRAELDRRDGPGAGRLHAADISRYRDELADGADRDRALVCTMATAGRAVLFPAMTVAL